MIWIRSIAFNLFFYLWTGVLLVGCLPFLLLPRHILDRAASLWVDGVNLAMRLLAGIRIEWRGREHIPPGPVLFAAKHQSAWDTVALLPVCGFPAMVMKKILLKIPIYGLMARKWQMIPIDREAGAKALKDLLRQAKAAADGGRPVLIFPQGTRVAPGAEAPYHPGAAALYLQLGLPCVPIALNSGYFWPRRRFLRKPGTLVVEILEPIPPGLSRAAFSRALKERTETASDRLLAEARAAEAGGTAPISGACDES